MSLPLKTSAAIALALTLAACASTKQTLRVAGLDANGNVVIEEVEIPVEHRDLGPMQSISDWDVFEQRWRR